VRPLPIEPQPSADAVASPAAPQAVEHSSEVEMTTERQTVIGVTEDGMPVYGIPWQRKQWLPTSDSVCEHCGLVQIQHINSLFCPEWRLRQLDGDR
jgi:hypothetical protein